MRLFNFRSLPVRVFLVLFAITIAITFDVLGQTDDEPSQAKQKIREFELRMRQQFGNENGLVDRNLLDSEEYQKPMRTFIAGLDNGEIRLEAMEMLRGHFYGGQMLGEGLAAELLEPLIRDADLTVRARSARAVGAYGCSVKYAKELIGLLEGEPSTEALINVAYAMGGSKHQPFVTHLEKMLGHADGEVRSKASSALTQLAPMTAFNHNIRLLDDKDPSVRSAALKNISHPPGNVVVTSIVRMLNDEDPEIREQAALALVEMKDSSTAIALKERISDEHPYVRSQAALSLAQMRKFPWKVAELLKDRDLVVRRKVAKAMGVMGNFHYIDNLRPLLEEEDSMVREWAAKSIAQLEVLKAGAEKVAALESKPEGEETSESESEARPQ